MGSLGSPKIWAYNKDCSLGFCSLYCPQWCYIIYPPPPPPLDFSGDSDGGGSSPNFSPIVVAIVGILASAFLLVSYYTIISKYCGNNNNNDRRRRSANENTDNHDSSDTDESRNPAGLHVAWHVPTAGLDEALIKAITVCKYKRGDGLIEGTDCSVCLSEFRDDESLRLLPKCSHAFHIKCIDTWLRSHSNCPLCRANVACAAAESAAPVGESADPGDHGEVSEINPSTVSSSRRAFSDLGNSEERHRTVIEIRRSVSMDFSGRDRAPVAGNLRTSHGGDGGEEEGGGLVEGRASCSKVSGNDMKGIIAMKRSVSSGRLRSLGSGRAKSSAVIPL